MEGKSALLTEELVRKAIDHVLPAITHFVAGSQEGQGFVRVYVGGDKLPIMDCGTIGRGVLHDEWSYEYSDFARKKCEIALREKMGVGDVLGLWLVNLEEEDILYRGGIYKLGIAVGVSGLEEDTDVLIARWILETIIMFVKRELQRRRQRGKDYL